ncbi:MAG: hypothetical protein J0I06_27440 [Planctomycetes bacterium]|nr:hypothetical protein [Planctomycetota bacterium]
MKAVRERLIRSTAALERNAVPYTVIGAHAVAYWVALRDRGATRNTPNVDLLVRPHDFERARAALEDVGFVSAPRTGPQVDFLDGPAGRIRDAVRLWFSGDVLRPTTEALPDAALAISAEEYRVVPLDALVRMKLIAFRTIDRVHLQDLIGVGLIDGTWPEKFPEVLAERLRQILANPDG